MRARVSQACRSNRACGPKCGKVCTLELDTPHNTRLLSPCRLQETIVSIKAEIPTASLRPLLLELDSLEAVRKAAAQVNTYPEDIHVRCLHFQEPPPFLIRTSGAYE